MKNSQLQHIDAYNHLGNNKVKMAKSVNRDKNKVLSFKSQLSRFLVKTSACVAFNAFWYPDRPLFLECMSIDEHEKCMS